MFLLLIFKKIIRFVLKGNVLIAFIIFVVKGNSVQNIAWT